MSTDMERKLNNGPITYRVSCMLYKDLVTVCLLSFTCSTLPPTQILTKDKWQLKIAYRYLKIETYFRRMIFDHLK